MALFRKQGTITVTATGNQTISGLTDPKAIILWGTPLAAAGTSAAAAHNSIGVGFATYRGGVVQQSAKALGAASSDPASSDGARLSSSSACFLTCDNGGAIDCEIDLVSMDADEVVINVANVDTTASIIVHYMILGGSDVSDALVVNSVTSTSSPQDISDPGGTFGQPDLVAVLGAGTSGTTATDAMLSIGWGIKDGAQFVEHWASDDAGSVALGYYQRLDRIYAMSVAPIAISAEASLAASSGWPTHGIELTWNDTAPNGTDHLGMLWLKGTFQKAIGSGTNPVAGSPPVTQDIALSFTPVAVFTFTEAQVASTTYGTAGTLGPQFQIGATDGTAEGSSVYIDGDGEATQRTRHRLSTTKTIEMLTQSGTTTTVVSDADAVLQTNNLRLSWTTISATAREYMYVALGDGGGTAYALDCQPGSVVVTGSAATVVSGRVVSADPGSFAVSGSAATTARGLFVSADPGSYAVTGAATTFLTGRVLSADPGSFAVTGVAATTAAGRVFNAEPGTYTIGGVAADLVHATPGVYILSADPASYAITGTAASPLATRLLSVDPGVFTVTGVAATVGRALTLSANPGSYTIAGADAAFLRTLILSAGVGVYAVDGVAAELRTEGQAPNMDEILTGWIAAPVTGHSGGGISGRIRTPNTGSIG